MAEYYDPETYPQQWNYLQTGTIIDQYMIERELAHGGFSSVYLARQLSDQVQVAIKEYLPRKLAHRTWNNVVVANNADTQQLFVRGRALFVEEAKVLAKLKHHNIVEVINFFHANETVYMVMTYDYGLTLDKVLTRRALKVTEDFLITVFSQLLTGLSVIHDHGILHLDLKPANMLIRADNDPLILDFGAIRRFPGDKQNQRAKVLTAGFSPIEQYDFKSTLGPWTDIYAVGATMRACLDAQIPPSAPDRVKQDMLPPAVKAYKGRFPEYLLNAIDWAMSPFPENRPQNVQALQQVFISG